VEVHWSIADALKWYPGATHRGILSPPIVPSTFVDVRDMARKYEWCQDSPGLEPMGY